MYLKKKYLLTFVFRQNIETEETGKNLHLGIRMAGWHAQNLGHKKPSVKNK